MQSEPQFFVNDFLVESQKEIEDVLKTLKTTEPKYQERAYFLKKFSNLMFRSYIKNKDSWKKHEHDMIRHETELELLEVEREKIAIEHLLEETEEKKKEKEKLKQELKKKLEEKKLEILKKMQGLEAPKPLFKPTPEGIPAPQPLMPSPPEIAPPIQITKKDLVASAETKKVLAFSEFNGTEYKITEPELNEKDNLLIQNIKTKLDATKIKDKNYLYPLIQNEAKTFQIEFNDVYYDKIRYYLLRDLNDFGIISPLLKDPKIKEIVCDGVALPIYLIYDEKHDINANIQFETAEEINSFIQSLAKKTNQTITPENPFLIAETDRFEIQATLGTEHSQARFVIERK